MKTQDKNKNLVVEFRVREFAKTIDENVQNVSLDFSNALSKKVEKVVEDAVKRAKSNGRRTVQANDI
jgi:histone H3/H4